MRLLTSCRRPSGPWSVQAAQRRRAAVAFIWHAWPCHNPCCGAHGACCRRACACRTAHELKQHTHDSAGAHSLHAGRPAAPRGSGHHLARLAAPQAALRAQGDAAGGLRAAAPERALGARGPAARGRGGCRKGCGVPASALRRFTGRRRRARIPCQGMHPQGACRVKGFMQAVQACPFLTGSNNVMPASALQNSAASMHTSETWMPLLALRHGARMKAGARVQAGGSIGAVWYEKQQQARTQPIVHRVVAVQLTRMHVKAALCGCFRHTCSEERAARAGGCGAARVEGRSRRAPRAGRAAA